MSVFPEIDSLRPDLIERSTLDQELIAERLVKKKMGDWSKSLGK